MLTRILTACVLIPLLVLILFFSGTLVYPIAWAILAGVAVFEMFRVFGREKDFWLSIPAYLIAVGLPFGYYFSDFGTKILLAATLVYLLFVISVAVFHRGRFPFADAASVFVAVIYISVGFAALSAIRYGIAFGKYLCLLAFIGPWTTDTFAYFTGRFFGRHKLIPEVSPKKTVEGSVGGTVFCIVGYIVFGLVMQFGYGFTVNYWMLGVAGLLVAVISQIGDLIASLIKREHEIKDYGRIFPGHGGVMDRFDSVLTTSILLWLLMQIGGGFAFLS
ncbi:MAG: phosphatidate cytidylyltransferase [Clostridia bacterium]|nr:phosphatidate cytidylyltransferase [Clostridia bacterium]